LLAFALTTGPLKPSIATTAIIESVTKPFGDLTQQHHMAAQFHLLLKLSSFAGEDVLSFDA